MLAGIPLVDSSPAYSLTACERVAGGTGGAACSCEFRSESDICDHDGEPKTVGVDKIRKSVEKSVNNKARKRVVKDGWLVAKSGTHPSTLESTFLPLSQHHLTQAQHQIIL